MPRQQFETKIEFIRFDHKPEDLEAWLNAFGTAGWQVVWVGEKINGSDFIMVWMQRERLAQSNAPQQPLPGEA